MKKIETRKQARKQRHKRVRARISGTQARPRLMVYRSNMHMYAYLINDETSTVLAAISDIGLKKGKTVVPRGVECAQQIGKAIATKAKEQGIGTVVFDRGGYKYHGNVKALAEEVRQQGISL